MPDTGHYRLQDLKLRWQRDPSSRLFLQLADEHRKLGQLGEAIAVLEQGLEHRPNDLSGLVSLGRCRLEMEQAAEAIEPLEAVVARDPTHIVANKLLLEAYLQHGDAEKAGQRLETYRLLNDRDPELDHLAYRLNRLREEEDQAATAIVASSLELDDVAAVEGGDLFLDEEAAATPADEAWAVQPLPPDEEPWEAVAVEEEPVEAAPIEAEPVEEELLDAASVEEESVEEELVEAQSVEEEPMGEQQALAERSPAPEEAVVAGLSAAAAQPLGSGPFQLVGGLPAAPDLEELWEHPPTPRPGLSDPFGELSVLEVDRHWALLAGEGIFTAPPAPPSAVEAAPFEPAEPKAPEPVAEAAAGEEVPPEPEAEQAAAASPAEEAAEEGESATATLGELYLRQGHREEAERIFRRVLERDPHNARALSGLERLAARPRRRQLTAADLLAVKSASGRIPEGLTAKKVLVLGNYIQHLRAADKHVH